MDLFEQGKSFAQQGQFNEALDALVLALENDKENPDLHFYLGLCYSSLEQFSYAKYHFDMALTLKPNHDKTRLVYEGLKNVTAEAPPERKMTRQATAKLRRAQADPPAEATESSQTKPTPPLPQNILSKGKVTNDIWESAFPADEMIKSESTGILYKIVMIFVAIAIVGALVYFGLAVFK